MIRELIYIVEILSVLKCIHCVYGEKIKINIGYVLTVVALFGTIAETNKYDAALEGTFSMYCILTIYCILMFRKPAKELIINTALYMIIITMLQLLMLVVFILLIQNDVLLRTLLADICVLEFCYILLPLIKIDRVAQWALKKNIIIYISTAYICLIVSRLLINMKVDGGTSIGVYLVLLPFIVCLYLITKQWRRYQESDEQKTKELQLYEDDKKKFNGLVANVRSRQHEMNNHIAAIMSMHYTEKSYEAFVNAQSEYCQRLMTDNKYNSLLSLYNSVLPGFLLDKFTHMEDKGIQVECKISVMNYESAISEYYLIEMLGILLDNAAEAIKEAIDNKKVIFEVMEIQNGFQYMVRNPFPYVTYDEIESWFAYEKSTKGPKRGIGLYHLKCLCEEWKCVVGCQNVEYDSTNYIEFKIETGRKA